jgi:hypothetical protein
MLEAAAAMDPDSDVRRHLSSTVFDFLQSTGTLALWFEYLGKLPGELRGALFARLFRALMAAM